MPSTSTNHQGAAPSPLADHIISFGRVLRRAGLTVGSHQIMDALRAVYLVGVGRQDDVYQALFGIFVQRREHIELFDHAFRIFWRAPSQLEEVLKMMLPQTTLPPSARPRQQTRIQQAMEEEPEEKPDSKPPSEGHEEEIELVATYSAEEVLREKDFADFTVEEVEQAKEVIRQMRWPIEPIRMRRQTPHAKGRRLHLRRTMQQSLRHQGEFMTLHRQGPKRKQRPIVVLCDISGSMDAYARMLLHFMHAVTDGLDRVESFVFGTRLTRITRYLRRRDIDDAIAAVTKDVNDWSGGTRIGEAIKDFNYHWLRRVLRSGGVVLIISDGCDRGDIDLLAREMERLSHNCHRLLWLNPLLGYDAYEPLTRGMIAALPHIDDFLPVHNLESLEQLGDLLSRLNTRRTSAWPSAYGRSLDVSPR